MRRHTIQCTLVHETVKKLGCHATADEIYQSIAQEHPNISRGTVYRNLQRLCETGDIQKCEIPGGADRFDHRCDNHYHVSCVKCGRVFDMDMDYVTDIEKLVKDTHGFVLIEHDIVFKGICSECNVHS